MNRIKKRLTIILSIINLIFSIFLVLMPLVLAKVVDCSLDIASSGDFRIKELLNNLSFDNELVKWWSIFVLIIFILIIIRLIESHLHFKWSVRLEKEIKINLYNTLMKKKISELTEYNLGQIQQMFSNDVDSIIKASIDYIPQVFRQLARITLAIIALIIIDIWFLVFIVFCAMLGYVAIKLYTRILRPRHKKVLYLDGITSGYVTESIENIKLIKANNRYTESSNYFSYHINNSLDAKESRNKLIFLANGGIFGFSNVSFLLAITYGCYLIMNKQLSYGMLIALLQLLNNIQTPFLALSSIVSNINLGKVSHERIAKVYALKDDDTTKIVEAFDEIIFENVCFSYDKIVHKDLNFSIKKGQTILLSGPSGIGKTTIFMLLMNFIKPTSGRIYLKCDNKARILDETARSLFSYVPQENILFSGNIMDNIYLLAGKKTEEEIDEAFKLANIYDEVMDMPQKYKTPLKHRGSGLSIGQIQRVMIAIALLNDKNIILLDEFSSALDSENEKLILDSLSKLDKTIIYITHKNNEIKVDNVIKLS